MIKKVYIIILLSLLTAPIFAKKIKVGPAINKINCKYQDFIKKYRIRYPFYVKNKKGKIKKYFIAPELMSAVILVESGGNSRAHRKDTMAKGLTQIIPKTAKLLRCNYNHLFNPEISIKCSMKYLASLLTHFKGDPIKALSSYNGGPLYTKKKANKDGIYNHPETKDYVNKVLNYYKYFKDNSKCVTDPETIRTNFALDKKILNDYREIDPTKVSKSIIKHVEDAIIVDDRNFSFEMKNEHEHLSFSAFIKHGETLTVSFPEEITIVDYLNGDKDKLTVYVPKNNKNSVKILSRSDYIGDRANVILELSCGISLELILTNGPVNTTFITYTHPEYVEEYNNHLKEKFKEEERKRLKAQQREQQLEELQNEQARKHKASILKKHEIETNNKRTFKMFTGAGAFFAIEHKDLDIIWNIPFELYYPVNPFDFGVFFSFAMQNDLKSKNQVYKMIKGTKWYDYMNFNILAQGRYRFVNKTNFEPFFSLGAGINLNPITKTEFVIEGTYTSIPSYDADEIQKAFAINAGFGLDMNLTDLLLIKLDTTYNYSAIGNHSIFLNLGFGFNFSFYRRKKNS